VEAFGAGDLRDGDKMFGLFKSREVTVKENRVAEIGKTLFHQISTVRDKVKADLINEEEFNARINSMFTAGYIVGYVDEHLCELFTDEKSKNKHAKHIFEGIFPGSGAKFIESKVSARMLGDTVSTENDKYINVYQECQEFDLGMSAARYEVSEFQINTDFRKGEPT
jgi:hypothetical protein